ncbi:unnamed protein product [Nippostrongylus brasiliensis]|uniref:Lipase_3 domain-containing protein n=1 Tax=Nippostrongylus brasiliensis TaxID=27835 RepID=A0A0N4Y0B8_NIPBR|nr:unnamed protein product [Nippostrongylus brasiliensis]
MRTILLLGRICSFILVASSSIAATYSDNFARTKMLPLSSAAYSTAPQNCLTNRFTSAVLRRQLTVKCDSSRIDECSGFTAVLNADKAIVISFRGTDNFLQLIKESDNTLFKSQASWRRSADAWIAGGKVSTYFNKAFMSLWNGGMKDDFNTLRSKYFDGSASLNVRVPTRLPFASLSRDRHPACWS